MVKPALYAVIEGAHISEKSHTVSSSNRQFVFSVAKAARKPQIKAAVEQLFGVQVSGVSVLNVKGKCKGQAGRNPGKRVDWKKAYVTLKPGFDIDFSSGEWGS